MHRTKIAVLLGLLLTALGWSADPIKLLIVDGQNNHDDQAMTPVMKAQLEKTTRFVVAVVTTPAKGAPKEAWNAFRPKFADFDVVLSNYNGEDWPKAVQADLEQYVAGGGGLVNIHAANNAFPNWPAWNQMIGLGWRKNDFGPRVSLNDQGSAVRAPAGSGPGAGHGRQHEYVVTVRDRQHPITKDMPTEWMHAKDELYHGQRGPAENMNILLSAYSDPMTGGTGAHEPMLWWIPFGQGRVVTNVLGHVGRTKDPVKQPVDTAAIRCVGFVTCMLRSCEWAANRPVVAPIPANFPSPTAVSLQP